MCLLGTYQCWKKTGLFDSKTQNLCSIDSKILKTVGLIGYLNLLLVDVGEMLLFFSHLKPYWKLIAIKSFAVLLGKVSVQSTVFRIWQVYCPSD